MYTIDKLNNEVTITVTVRYSRKLRFRLWLAKKAYIFGAWVSGMNIVWNESQIAESE